MMVFPFTVPTDGEGRMLDQAQSIYARALARTLAERLTEPPRLAARLAALTTDGPGQDAGARGHGWVVVTQPWTLDEACRIGLPEGTEYLLHGSAELTDRVRLRILLVDSPSKKLTLDHVVLRPVDELFSALDEAAAEIARALGERPPDSSWPTRNVEAFLAYLRGRDMSAAHEAGVRVADPRKSFEPYLEAARRDPHFADAQDRLLALALDFALGGQGPVDVARAGCERLLAIDPTAHKAHAALAEIDLMAGNPAAAEEHLKRALRLHAWPPLYERMGTTLSRLLRFGEAISWFERAVAERADDADAVQGLGVALAQCGRHQEAVAAFLRALSLGVQTAHLHDNLATALLALGRGKEARAHRHESRRISGKPRIGLYLLRDAWEWLSSGTSR
jgi:tetratricopeptide (TPR) repeat protein